MTFNLQAANDWYAGDLDKAEDLQMQTVAVIEEWVALCGSYNPQKSILKMTGIDFGPLRLPQENMPADLEKQLGTALHSLGLNITSEYINTPEAENIFLN
jgi:dihydrodipicolinate synthase/N-acetylneuraminate lyase